MFSVLALGISLAVLGSASARSFSFIPAKPTDCKVRYSPWTDCDVECGQGQQSRWGFVVEEAKNGGRPCPELEQSRICDSGIPCTPPPQDCKVQYSEWTPCDAQCGQGQQQRWGFAVAQPANGGQPCPELEQTRPCDSGIPCTPPPQDCQVRYSAWSECDAPCGQGLQQRWGTVVVPAANGGQPCPELEQERSCDTGVSCVPQPIDCEVRFGEWSECTKLCGGGQQWRQGVVLQQPQFGGQPCPELEQERSCNEFECDEASMDCQVWYGEWSSCSASCGGGYQWRRAVIETPQMGAGKPCPELEQERSCNDFECTVQDQDCQVWFGDWSDCSKPCGGGFQTRRGIVEQPQVGNGLPCPALEQRRPCNELVQCTENVVDCQVTYSAWTECSKPCGGGERRRWGTVVTAPTNGGRPCSPLEQVEPCNEELCDVAVVDCLMRFSEWSQCSAPCGGGVQQRWGEVVMPASNGGKPCPPQEQQRDCNIQPCLKKVDCQVQYADWSQCSASCGGGQQWRRGVVVAEPQNGGLPCPPLEEERACSQFECDEASVDCQMWYGEWSVCDQPCGGGQQFRRGVVEVAPRGSGKQCPPEMQYRACNRFECCEPQPTDCQVRFSPWTQCSAPCGGGVRQRWGTVVQEPLMGGAPCPALEQEEACNEQLCDQQIQDCEVDFSEWSPCSSPCAGGKQLRWGVVRVQPTPGGKPCPALEQERDCNTDINCVPGVQDCLVKYSDWTACSKPCGGGSRQRWGTIVQEASAGGKPCPELEQEEDCNTHACKRLAKPSLFRPRNFGQRQNFLTQLNLQPVRPSFGKFNKIQRPSFRPKRYSNPVTLPALPTPAVVTKYFCAGTEMCEPCRGKLRQGAFRPITCPQDAELFDSQLECGNACSNLIPATLPTVPIPATLPVKRDLLFFCDIGDSCLQCDRAAGECPQDVGLYRSAGECRSQCKTQQFNDFFANEGHKSRPKRSDVLYFCGIGDSCLQCDRAVGGGCPQDVGLYRSAGECRSQCKTQQFNDFFANKEDKSRPKRDAETTVTTLYYCGSDVEEGEGTEECSFCTQTVNGEGEVSDDCPTLKEGSDFHEDIEDCSDQCGSVAKRSVQRSRQFLPIRQPKFFPRRKFNPVPAFPKTPKYAPKKPKAKFDCARKEDGSYANPLIKCSNLFYMCSNGHAEEMKCAKNLYYDTETQECDIHAYVPACSGGRRPATTTPEPRLPAPVTPDPEFDCTKRPNGVYEDPRQKCSSKFYSCSNGQTTREECQENLFYDANTKSCLSWASIYKCSGKLPKKPVKKPIKHFDPPKKVPVDCRKLGNGAFPDPRKQCSQTWYSCANGVGYEMTCPALTFFNPELKDCDAFNNIFACSRRRPEPQVPTPPPKQPEKFPFNCANKEDGFYSAGKCVAFYWACSGDVTSKMTCTDGMVYDSELEICDFKFNIPRCGGVRPTLPPQIPTSPKPKVNFDCIKRKDGNFAAGKCQPFYFTCSGGEANKMQCPKKLFYDSETDECGAKKHVPECGGKRPSKEPLTTPLPAIPAPLPSYKPRTAFRPITKFQPSKPFGSFGGRFNAVPQPTPVRRPVRPTLKSFAKQRFQNNANANLDNSARASRFGSIFGNQNSGSSAGGVIGGKERATG